MTGVIFDLDGTLADTLPVCFAAFRLLFQKRLGRTYTNSEIRAMFGPSEEGVVARLLDGAAEDGLRDYLRFFEQEHVRCPRPFEGIGEALELIRARGLKAALVTGKGPRSTEISLRRLGLSDCFDPIESGSPEGGVKRECMERVLTGWAADPASVAAVGDAPPDILSARALGVIALGAAWAPGADATRLEPCGPERIFFEVGEFTEWLRGAAGG